MTYYTIDDGKVFATITAGIITTAILTDLTHHLSAVGNARLGYTDEYDEQFGIALAVSRATERLNKKVQKKLIRSIG